jgi:hypothetical protein
MEDYIGIIVAIIYFTGYSLFVLGTLAFLIKLFIDWIKDKKKMNMENQEQNKSLHQGGISKWRVLPFENRVNVLLLCLSCILNVASIFAILGAPIAGYDPSSDEILIWIIASTISAIFIGIWYYLNYQRFTVEQCKKYGVIFIVAGFLSLISPFIALALLIEGTIMLKKVFTNSNSQESIKPQEKSINVAVQESIDINPRPADQPQMSKIEEVWNFMDFAKMMGQPKRATLTNKETGENFAALMFPTPQGDREFTMVAFSSDLGELTAKEIVDRKDELYIVKLESGNYYLRDNLSFQ